jgi:hypothetical protein
MIRANFGSNFSLNRTHDTVHPKEVFILKIGLFTKKIVAVPCTLASLCALVTPFKAASAFTRRRPLNGGGLYTAAAAALLDSLS